MPFRPAKDIGAERHRVAEIVFLHDPRRTQGADIQAVLDVELFEHHLFEDFR